MLIALKLAGKPMTHLYHKSSIPSECKITWTRSYLKFEFVSIAAER